VNEMDSATLTPELVQVLLEMLPTEAEMEQAKAYCAKSYSDALEGKQGSVPAAPPPAAEAPDVLVPAERWFVEICRVHQAVPKVRALSFMSTAVERANELQRKCAAIEHATAAVLNSDALVALVQMVLMVGNQLNQGSSNGGAVGFTVGSLLKLTQTKGVDRSTTVLDYLVRTAAQSVAKSVESGSNGGGESSDGAVAVATGGCASDTGASFERILRLSDELLPALQAAQYPAAELLVEARSIGSGIKQLKIVASTVQRHVDFVEELERTAMVEISKAVERQKIDSGALSGYFGERTGSGSAAGGGPALLEALSTFMEQLRDSIKKNSQQIKQRRRLKAKRARK
jgi:hypothetical protein